MPKFSKISKEEFEKLKSEGAIGVLNPDESSKVISKYFKELELPEWDESRIEDAQDLFEYLGEYNDANGERHLLCRKFRFKNKGENMI